MRKTFLGTAVLLSYLLGFFRLVSDRTGIQLPTADKFVPHLTSLGKHDPSCYRITGVKAVQDFPCSQGNLKKQVLRHQFRQLQSRRHGMRSRRKCFLITNWKVVAGISFDHREKKRMSSGDLCQCGSVLASRELSRCSDGSTSCRRRCSILSVRYGSAGHSGVSE